MSTSAPEFPTDYTRTGTVVVYTADGSKKPYIATVYRPNK